MDSKDVTLASMHSISKGFYGECGRRGGYLELMNVNPDVVSEFYKLASINLCSNLNGQICMALVMNPPRVRIAPQALQCMSILHIADGSPCLGSPAPLDGEHHLSCCTQQLLRSAPWIQGIRLLLQIPCIFSCLQSCVGSSMRSPSQRVGHAVVALHASMESLCFL